MAGARMLALALLAVSTEATTEATSGAGTFVPGAVCADVTETTKAEDMLRGKHLVINVLWWGPYEVPDATAPKGWSGLNIDVYDRLSEMLHAHGNSDDD